MPRKIYTSKIISKDNLTSNVIYLSIAKPKEFIYIAGQFIQFYIPDPANEKNEVLRSYSIASAPNEKDLKFCVKLVPNGKSGQYFEKTKAGKYLKFSGPVGKFTNMDATNPLYFIATSVGLAPIMSIIQDELINKKTTQPIHLLFGIRTENDVFWTEILDNLKKTYKNFDYKLTLSQPSPEWKGLKGRVTAHLSKKISAKGEKNSHYFLCGSISMIKDVSSFLETQGLPKTNIHFEAF